MTTIILWSLFCFLAGAWSFGFYKRHSYRVLPEKGQLDLNAFFSHTLIQEGETTRESDKSLVITLKNVGEQDIQLESWFIRALGPAGFFHQFFISPQNLVKTLPPQEKSTLEIQDISFLEGERLHTIIIRDIYGREWELSAEQIKTLQKSYFWDSL